MDVYNKDHYAVIMAGGIGTRLWPVSTAKNPKQFHDILGGGESLLQNTFKRLCKFIPFENIWILTNESYKELVLEHLPKINEEQIVLEPAMRNTAPCILMAALKIKKQNPDAIMLVAPSDHWINDNDAFVEDMEQCFELASKGSNLVTLGIEPGNPHTGYGYIKFRQSDNAEKIKKVEKFTEKPTLKKAKKFLEDGNYLWNAGIFIWKAEAILNNYENLNPEMYSLFNKAWDVYNTKGEQKFIEEIYPSAQNISIDYSILEKADNVYVVPASFGWNDLGTWGAIYEELPKDKFKNASVAARLMPEAAEENLVYSQKNKIVVIEGLKDFIIINTNDVLLIVPKGKEQQIKDIRARVIDTIDENLG